MRQRRGTAPSARQVAATLLGWALLMAACDAPTAKAPAPAPTANGQPGHPPEATPLPLAAGQTIEVPAGRLWLGSETGSPLRNPALEADGIAVTVPAFTIDRLPFPNDPTTAPLTGLSRPQAAERCRNAGKRLCSEFEWERACKGDTRGPFATGSAPSADGCHRAPAQCLSPIGVGGLGVGLSEWTASTAGAEQARPKAAGVIRGGAPDGQPGRCASRTLAPPETTHDKLGFRCCQGGGSAPDAAPPYPVEPKRPLIAPLDESAEALRAALATVPELSALASSFDRYARQDVDEALRRGKRRRGNITAWHIAPSAFRWSPARGEEYWVLSGRAEGKGLLALLYPRADGFGLAASTVFDEKNPVLAIGYTDDKPAQLLFTTCFGCPGESGDIHYRDGRIQVRYR